MTECLKQESLEALMEMNMVSINLCNVWVLLCLKDLKVKALSSRVGVQIQ